MFLAFARLSSGLAFSAMKLACLPVPANLHLVGGWFLFSMKSPKRESSLACHPTVAREI
jgi:hypothetical protein